MKIAILGCGKMGEYISRKLKKSLYVDEIICQDVREERVKELQEKGYNATSDLDKILDDPQIPLVFVTSSNDAHKMLTISALNKGKAVMCEKPMANTLADAEAMVAAAEKNNGWLQIGFELRYSHLYVQIKEWIEAGLLGDVINVSCNYIASARKKDSWRNKKESCGCLFGEKLSHYVDLPRWWINDKVEEVFTVCAPNAIPYYETRDNYHATYKFSNGAVSHITFMMSPASHFDGDPLQNVLDQQEGDGHELRFIISGTKGAAETDVFRRAVKRWEYKDDVECMKSVLVEQHTWDAENDNRYFHNTADQACDIVRRVAEGLAPKTPASDALETMELCFAAEQSADLNKVIKLSDFKQK